VVISRFSSAGQLLPDRFFCPDESTTDDGVRPSTGYSSRDICQNVGRRSMSHVINSSGSSFT
jgi:hypothetical protein